MFYLNAGWNFTIRVITCWYQRLQLF